MFRWFLQRLAQCALAALLVGLAGCPSDKNEPQDSAVTSIPPPPLPSADGAGAAAAPGNRPALPLVAMSVDKFNAAWQINIDVQQQPLGDVLKQLVAKVPNWQPQIEADDEAQKDLLVRPVTLKLAGVSAVEGIHRACHAADARPEFDVDVSTGKEVIRIAMPADGKAVPLDLAERVQFVGPFTFELLKLKEHPPTATGEFVVQAVWLQLPAAVSALQGRFSYTLESVTGAGEVDLLGGVGSPISMAVSHDESVLQRTAMSRELKYLLRSVKAIESIRGRVQLTIPTAVKTIWFDHLESNWAMDEGATTVTLNQVNKHGSGTYVQYSVRHDEPLEGMRAFAFNAQGQPIEGENRDASWGGDGRGNGSVSFDGEVAQLAIVVVTAKEQYEREFAFSNIPLAESGSQPEKLTELDFAGHDAPLSIGVLSLKKDQAFHKLQFRAINHANKDIREVHVTFNYLDAAGKQLEDHKDWLSGKGFDLQSVLVGAGASVELEMTAFFFPDNGAKAEIAIRKIKFTDGTEWSPNEN